MRSTHTYAILQVDAATYKDIEDRLRAVNYGHCIHDGKIDMTGIAIQIDPVEAPGRTMSTKERARRLAGDMPWVTSYFPPEKYEDFIQQVRACLDAALEEAI